jgi:thiol-disulfide isomerase/thioredoxin
MLGSPRRPASRSLAGVIVATALATGLASPVSAVPDAPGIRWQKSFKAALKEARGTGRPVLVDFWAEWCHWCHELDETTYRDPAVVAAAAAFVPVKVNTEGSLGEKEISAEYGVEILPTIAFLSPLGHVILWRDSFEGPEAFAATLAEAREAARHVMAWEKALEADKSDASALAGLGTHLVQEKQAEEGRDLLERAARHDDARPVPERKRTRILLASLGAASGRYGDAEKRLREALALQPPDPAQDAAALLGLGRVCLEQGKLEEARGAFRKAVATDPGGPDATRAEHELSRLTP